MDICPRCKSNEIRKDGIVREKQRYRCKLCGFRYTVIRIGKPINKKKEAIIMYLLGYDYRTIGEIIDTSHVTVFSWLGEFGKPLKDLRGEKQKPVDMEYIGQYMEQIPKQLKAMLLIGFSGEKADIMMFKK